MRSSSPSIHGVVKTKCCTKVFRRKSRYSSHQPRPPLYSSTLQELIENPSIPKIGANIRSMCISPCFTSSSCANDSSTDDGVKLLRDYGIVAANLVELGSLAREADPEFSSKRSIVGLASMIEKYCDGKVLQKGPVRISNWEAVPLTRQQLDCKLYP